MLHKKEGQLLDGLRPRLPTIEQCKNGEPAVPFDKEQKAKEAAKVAKETQSSKKNDNLVQDMSTDELLGL